MSKFFLQFVYQMRERREYLSLQVEHQFELDALRWGPFDSQDQADAFMSNHGWHPHYEPFYQPIVPSRKPLVEAILDDAFGPRKQWMLTRLNDDEIENFRSGNRIRALDQIVTWQLDT